MRIGFDAVAIAGHSGIERYTRSLIGAMLKAAPEHKVHLCTSFRKVEKVRSIFNPQPNLHIDNPFPHPLILGRLGARPIESVRKLYLDRKVASRYDLFHYTNPFYFPHGVKKRRGDDP